MIGALKKYFIPNEKNEYKPHIMREASLAVISSLALFLFFIGTMNVALIQNSSLLSAVISGTIVSLANENRTENKIGNLTINPILELAAQRKANDMATKGYFAHTSPDGKTPWYWFEDVGYDFVYAGENLAVNFSDSEEVDDAWMNSAGHRANILNSKFTEIGVATARGFYKGYETVFVVQMFGKPQEQSRLASQLPDPVTEITNDKKDINQNQIVQTNANYSSTTLPAKSANVSTTSTTTLSEKSNGFSVLGQAETYIELQDGGESIQPIYSDKVTQKQKFISLIGRIITSPKMTIGYLYIFLGAFVLLSLILMIIIEVRKQHTQHILYGIGLLALIIILTYVYRASLFSEILIV